jgi:hypothetical protein
MLMLMLLVLVLLMLLLLLMMLLLLLLLLLVLELLLLLVLLGITVHHLCDEVSAIETLREIERNVAVDIKTLNPQIFLCGERLKKRERGKGKRKTVCVSVYVALRT